ncbi:MAG: isochorismatase family protein, partial [Hyphomicrobiales bacterium]
MGGELGHERSSRRLGLSTGSEDRKASPGGLERSCAGSAGSAGPLLQRPGLAGSEISDEGAHRPVSTFHSAHFPNSFRDTRLQELLKLKGIEEVVIVGAMSHMCVDATVRAANDFGYKTITIHDACATLD